jgi:hypothetical protein
LVSEEEGGQRGNWAVWPMGNVNLACVLKLIADGFYKAFRKYRRPEIADALTIYLIE